MKEQTNDDLKNAYILKLNELEDRLRVIENDEPIDHEVNWRKSFTKKFFTLVIVYVTITFTMAFLDFDQAYIAAFVPTIAYWLGSIFLSVIRRRFIGKLNK